MVKHYPATVNALSEARANLLNMGGERYVLAANITGVDKLGEEELSELRGAYTLTSNQSSQIRTIHGLLLGTVPPHSIRQRAGLKASAAIEEAVAAADGPKPGR